MPDETNLFAAACRAIEILREAGYEAWLVGGSVRDYLLGQDPKSIGEFDLATDATPTQVEQTFKKTFPAGKAFGVVRVRVLGHWMEVATFRTESSYSDGRHPDAVEFATAQEDVQRRDFSVNGLLWDPISDTIRDEVDGLQDLKDHLIRAIGSPEERFHEDGLRLLRAVRFGASGKFTIEPKTLAAVREQVGRLSAVAPERIREELIKIAQRSGSRRGDAWRLLCSTGLASSIFGEHLSLGDPNAHAEVMDRLQHRSLPLFLAVALRSTLDSGAPPARWRGLAAEVGERLRCSAKEIELLGELLASRQRYLDLSPKRRVRCALAATRPEFAMHEDLLQAEGGADQTRVLELLIEYRKRCGGERPKPIVDGRLLMDWGVARGPLLGWTIRCIRVWQLKGLVQDIESAHAKWRARQQL